MSFDTAPPLSKTAKYKKITKPLLERKRRARINRCLDELKDLMVSALEIDDDNLSKLEKADILELTVNHLTKLHSPKDPVTEAQKFQAGFGQCAAEACRFIMAVPDLDTNVSQNLISHLSRLITVQPLSIQVPERPSFTPPQTSPSSVISDRQHYFSDYDRSSSDAEDSTYSGDGVTKQWTHKQSQRSSVKQSPPLTGLLTTVDKLAEPCYPSPEQTHATRNSTYFNRVPAEAKDVILKKIRQHIMDKRGNYVNGDVMGNQTAIEHRQSQGDANCHYSPNVPSSNYDTLDLRKVRTPAKYASEQIHSPEKAVGVAYREANQLDTTPLADSKVEVPSLPEQCELPMDYSYLPKKKRKLIEYQEHKKQEEAKRRLDAFCEKKNDNHEEGPPGNHEVDCNKWRPW